jgi:hypothetical protein
MAGLCLAGAGLAVHLAVTSFTLSWIHTIEKVPWQEDWRVEPDALVLVQSRIKGSGAGMDPPPQAKPVDGWYAWAPDNPRRDKVVLRREAGIADWTFCAPDVPCTEIGKLLDADPLTLTPCP